jgi:hypothetical protein
VTITRNTTPARPEISMSLVLGTRSPTALRFVKFLRRNPRKAMTFLAFFWAFSVSVSGVAWMALRMTAAYISGLELFRLDSHPGSSGDPFGGGVIPACARVCLTSSGR